MKIIAFVNQKGGTAKTTTLISLAAYLANSGKKVLVVDLDPQANASSGLGIDDRKQGIYEVLSQQIPLEQGIRAIRGNLWAVPANQNLAGANIELVNLPNRELILSQYLKRLSPNDFDYIFIDTSPSLGLTTINALVASDYTIIPVQAEYYALEGLSQLLHTINLIKQDLKPGLGILGAVLTMYDGRSRLSNDVWQELYRYFPHKIFRTVIPRNVRLAEAPSYGKTILEYAPRSRGARAYERLAKEFIILNDYLNRLKQIDQELK